MSVWCCCVGNFSFTRTGITKASNKSHVLQSKANVNRKSDWKFITLAFNCTIESFGKLEKSFHFQFNYWFALLILFSNQHFSKHRALNMPCQKNVGNFTRSSFTCACVNSIIGYSMMEGNFCSTTASMIQSN